MGEDKSSKQKLPESEFSILRAALAVLVQLEKKDLKHGQHFQSLIDLCCREAKSSDERNAAEDKVYSLIEKFERKSFHGYGEEGFDLKVISESLIDEAVLESYLLRSSEFNYKNQRQLINIITKIINHFGLEDLARLFKKKYFSEVDLIQVVKYLDPEHKKGEVDKVATRYGSLLTVNRTKKIDEITPTLNQELFKTTSEFRLIPKDKMNPRLPLELSEAQTPAEKKHQIEKKERLVTAAEIVLTDEVLKKCHNKHASLTPGPLCLGSFPVLSSINKDAKSTETVDDLIAKYNIDSVLTIEAKNVAERIYDDEIKALPSDWVKRGVSVGLIQCPDLEAMRVFHTLLAAQHLFSEVLLYLPAVKNSEYSDLINALMEMRFQEADENPAINEKSRLKVVYNKVTSLFSHKKANDEIRYLHLFMNAFTTALQVEKQEDSSSELRLEPKGRVLVHCKAGMSRSATALLTMYIFFVDVILGWHYNDFIHNEEDESFFGAIIKAICYPTKEPLEDAKNIVHIFSKNYRLISPLTEQIVGLAQIIHYKRNLLAIEALSSDSIKLAEASQISNRDFKSTECYGYAY